MDSSGAKVPLVSGDGRQVPEELKPLHDYYEKWNKEMGGTWPNLVSEKVREIWELNPNLKISQCIVIGLGSLDNAMQIQISASSTPIQAPEHGTGYPMEVKQFIVAHPLFTKLDKAYLECHGYKVLEGDSGFDLVDSNTLLFNMNCDNQLPQWPANIKAHPPVYAGPSFESIIEGWIAEKQQRASSLTKYQKKADFNFDTKPMEDYMNITNAYSFPSSGNQDLLQAVEFHGQSDATIGAMADYGAFRNFAIRVVKTVHKDHQPS